jgi:hypothetical protein
MATNPNQTPEDLTTPHVPTRAEGRIAELRSRLPQPSPNPPPGPEPPEPPRAASPQPPTHRARQRRPPQTRRTRHQQPRLRRKAVIAKERRQTFRSGQERP